MTHILGLMLLTTAAGLLVFWRSWKLLVPKPPQDFVFYDTNEHLLLCVPMGEPVRLTQDGELVTIDWKDAEEPRPACPEVRESVEFHHSKMAEHGCGSLYIEATDAQGEILVRHWSSSLYAAKDVRLMTGSVELRDGALRQNKAFVCDILPRWKLWVLKNVLRHKPLEWKV